MSSQVKWTVQTIRPGRTFGEKLEAFSGVSPCAVGQGAVWAIHDFEDCQAVVSISAASIDHLNCDLGQPLAAWLSDCLSPGHCTPYPQVRIVSDTLVNCQDGTNRGSYGDNGQQNEFPVQKRPPSGLSAHCIIFRPMWVDIVLKRPRCCERYYASSLVSL